MNTETVSRAGSALCLGLACATVGLLIAGSDVGWLALAATGIALVAGSFIQDGYSRAVRAVMAAGGLALTLFGLLPWSDIAAVNFS